MGAEIGEIRLSTITVDQVLRELRSAGLDDQEIGVASGLLRDVDMRNFSTVRRVLAHLASQPQVVRFRSKIKALTTNGLDQPGAGL